MHPACDAPLPTARPARRLGRRLAAVAVVGVAVVTGLTASPASAHGTTVPCTTWRVRGGTDNYSLRIPYGATAESRTICVSKGEDVVRLFARNPGVRGSILHVDVIVRNPGTGAVAQTAFDVNGDAAPLGWAPTMRRGIAQQWSQTGTEELTFGFSTRGTAATWQIDDVYVDPFRST